VLLQNGRVAAIGRDLEAPPEATVVDGRGKWLTPGIIDVHSHLGVYASPGVSAHEDGNEMTDPGHAERLGRARAVAAGSGLRRRARRRRHRDAGAARLGQPDRRPRRHHQERAGGDLPGDEIPGAPWGLKMACGENPKRVYGSKGGSPMTRMGNVAGYRAAFYEAQAYMRSWDKYLKGQQPDAPAEEAPKKKHHLFGRDKDEDEDEEDGKDAVAPDRDLAKDTLMGAMKGEIRVHIHCYRADEMAIMLDLAKEFGFKVAAFHHGVEAYKIADRLAAEGVCGALWADWWGFKMEAWTGIEENIALGRPPCRQSAAIVHSDPRPKASAGLNQEAARPHGARASWSGSTSRPETMRSAG
jgi:imidazolonepropionase-like amidohydrolase